MKTRDIVYSDKVNCKFSEAVFQEMAAKRYGIKFCCNDDLDRRLIDKELLDMNDIHDYGLECVIPIPPEPLPLFECCVPCTNLEADKGIPNNTFFELSAMVTNGEHAYVLDDFLFGLGATQSERDFLFSIVSNLWSDYITEVVLEVAVIHLNDNISEPYASDLRSITFSTLQYLIFCKDLVINPNTCIR